MAVSETLNQLKLKILDLTTKGIISPELSIKIMDSLAKNELTSRDSEKALISLTTLSLREEEIEKMIDAFTSRKALIKKESDYGTTEVIGPTIEQLDKALEKEKQNASYDYREHVYNYILTIFNDLDDSTFLKYFTKIKAEHPELTEHEFQKTIKRVKEDDDLIKGAYDSTERIDETLEFVVAIESDEIPALNKDYVSLIQDPASYIIQNIQHLSLNTLLTREEESYYGKLLFSDDPIKKAEAKQKFTLANLRLIMHVVRRFARDSEELANLYDEGFIGLQKAVQKFDYRKNYKFSTYAIWWIRQAILKYLQTTSRTIRIPIYLISQVTKAIKIEKRITKRKGSQAKKFEIVNAIIKELKIPRDKAKTIYGLAFNEVKLEEMTNEKIEEIHSGGRLSYRDKEEELEKLELEYTLDNLLQKLLTEKEYQIIKRRFGLPPFTQKMTLQKISEEFSVSKERIRQIESNAQSKLSSDYVKQTLSVYLTEN